jgi:hypothetical protein
VLAWSFFAEVPMLDASKFSPAFVVLALSAACSTPSPGGGFADQADSGTPGDMTPDGGFGINNPDAKPNDGCSEEAKLVYVLSLEGDIYSFAPAMKKFTKIAPLRCSAGGADYAPVSMAVDRKAVAWVNMRDPDFFGSGESTIFRVDTKTGACTPTNIKGNVGGMGFSTNKGTTDQETLFVIGSTSGLEGGLLKVDFAQQKLTPVAKLREQVDLELTGTGDGRLFGFLISNPLALAEMDKTTTALSGRVTLAQVPRPQAPMFAFSFWGGDFYFYTATSDSPSTTTTVSRYRPSDGSVDNAYMRSIGFHIVGAGVSTCAPLTGPS